MWKRQILEICACKNQKIICIKFAIKWLSWISPFLRNAFDRDHPNVVKVFFVFKPPSYFWPFSQYCQWCPIIIFCDVTTQDHKQFLAIWTNNHCHNFSSKNFSFRNDFRRKVFENYIVIYRYDIPTTPKIQNWKFSYHLPGKFKSCETDEYFRSVVFTRRGWQF